MNHPCANLQASEHASDGVLINASQPLMKTIFVTCTDFFCINNPTVA